MNFVDFLIHQDLNKNSLFRCYHFIGYHFVSEHAKDKSQSRYFKYKSPGQHRDGDFCSTVSQTKNSLKIS